jgi:hypothetical protein
LVIGPTCFPGADELTNSIDLESYNLSACILFSFYICFSFVIVLLVFFFTERGRWWRMRREEEIMEDISTR